MGFMCPFAMLYLSLQFLLLPREQAQDYVGNPSSSDSRRGLKPTWQEASSTDSLVEPVAGGSRDKPHKLTSAEKGSFYDLRLRLFLLI